MQVVFGEASSQEDAVALQAYEQVKEVIRGCLDLNLQTRSRASQVQKTLFSIMQQNSWGHDLGLIETLPAAEGGTQAESLGKSEESALAQLELAA